MVEAGAFGCGPVVWLVQTLFVRAASDFVGFLGLLAVLLMVWHNFLMKSFQEMPLAVQWVVALLLASLCVMIVGSAAFVAAMLLGVPWDAPLPFGLVLVAMLTLFLPVWMLILGFFFAPLLRLSGTLRYYSPFLIIPRARRGRLELHGALPFDYLLLFRWSDRGRPAVCRILLWYVEGLLALAREIEQGQIRPEIEISATSYVFGEHTARRFGFRVERDPRFSLGGVVTYPTQMLTYSFAKGRWALPPISQVKRATISGGELVAQIPCLERSRRRLQAACGLRG